MHSSKIENNVKEKKQRHQDWKVIKNLLPYIKAYKARIIFTLICLVLAKMANLGVPIMLKNIVDAMSITSTPKALLVVPVSLIVAYGLLRLSASLFAELRELIFSKVTEQAVRQVGLQVFNHLHALSLRFHLSRQTGGMTRDIERGTRGIQSLISYSLYSIIPTLIELAMVLGYLLFAYDVRFVLVTFIALICYVVFTVVVTEWRTNFRREMNSLDSQANQSAVDTLINFETVKYFGNEQFESARYDVSLKKYAHAVIKSQKSLAFLNFGQQIIIVFGLVCILGLASQGVAKQEMTIGDLDGVLVVESLSFKTPWERASFESELLLNDLAHYFVVEEFGIVVGYAGFWHVIDEGHITNVAIHPEYRKRGLGKYLIDYLVNAQE